MQPKAKADLKEIWMAEGRADAEKAFNRFLADGIEAGRRDAA
jgi:hypothetical protein